MVSISSLRYRVNDWLMGGCINRNVLDQCDVWAAHYWKAVTLRCSYPSILRYRAYCYLTNASELSHIHKSYSKAIMRKCETLDSQIQRILTLFNAILWACETIILLFSKPEYIYLPRLLSPKSRIIFSSGSATVNLSSRRISFASSSTRCRPSLRGADT